VQGKSFNSIIKKGLSFYLRRLGGTNLTGNLLIIIIPLCKPIIYTTSYKENYSIHPEKYSPKHLYKIYKG